MNDDKYYSHPLNQKQNNDNSNYTIYLDSMYTTIDASNNLKFVLDSGSSAHIVNADKNFREY